MDVNVFVGHHCPRCGTVIGIYSSVGGGELRCPGCGGEMRAAKGDPKVTVIANARCANCNLFIGVYSGVGGDGCCPNCGGALDVQ